MERSYPVIAPAFVGIRRSRRLLQCIMRLAFVFCATPFIFAAGGTPSASAPGGTAAGPAVVAPVVTLPEAPTVTAPAAPVLSPDTMTPSAKKASGAGAAKPSTPSQSAANLPGTSASALSLLGLGSDSPLLKALSGSDSDSAGLDALSTLLGGSSTPKASTSTDQATLEKILALLQKQQESATASGAAAVPGAAENPPPSAEKRRISSGGELVRFSVNGYDVLSSVRTEVSSVLARDGSFLITCDRAYPVSGRRLAESVYLLCRKTGSATYRLYADVSQSETNPHSFPYRLSRKTPISGTLTGDLLVFRSVESDWKLDLVIRVISPIAR